VYCIDAAYCYTRRTFRGLCLVFGTPVSPAKTDEPIAVPFGQTLVGPRYHVLDAVHVGATW